MICGAKLTQIGIFKPMKQVILIILLLLPMLSKAQPEKVPVRFLQDYYYYGINPLKEGVNAFVVTKRREFEKLFGKTNRPDTPDFNNEWMIVLAMPKTKWNAKIEIDKVSMKAGSFIEIYTHIDDGRRKFSYDTYPIKVAIIPKFKNVKKLHFYDGKKLHPLTTLDVD